MWACSGKPLFKGYFNSNLGGTLNGSQRSRSESQRFDPNAVPLVTRVESVNLSSRDEGASSTRLLACGISWWL